MTTLYTVTTIDPKLKYGSWNIRAVCTTVDDASRIIESNEFDIHELTDDYAVIASIYANIAYGISHEFDEIWYQWQGDSENGQYKLCQKPEQYKQIAAGL